MNFLKRTNRLFKGDRKYLSIVFFILLLILLIGLFIPYYLSNTTDNWEDVLSDRIKSSQTEIIKIINAKENDLILKKNNLKSQLHLTLNKSSYDYGALITSITNNTYDDLLIEIVAPNGRVIAWNKASGNQKKEIFPLGYPLSEIHFETSGLEVLLALTDTIKIQNDIFYLMINKPIEKLYDLQNRYYQKLSLQEELTDDLNLDVKIEYNPYAQPSKDGRIYSFPLLNKSEIKIGLVEFFKPSLNTVISEIQNLASNIQTILIIVLAFILGFSFKSDFKKVKSNLIKLILLIIYSAAIRTVIFTLGFPSNFLNSTLTEPAYFSSTFAGGIVKSPIEMFITSLFILIISVYVLIYARIYVAKKSTEKFRILKLAISPVLAILSFYVLRGLAASVRSIIFDSTIRYFKEPDLLPDLPSLLMNLNLLMLGFACVSVIISLLFILSEFLGFFKDQKNTQRVIIYLIMIQVAALIFFMMLKEPLVSEIMVFIFLCLMSIVLYRLIIKKINFASTFILIAVIASIISITLLNYFNLRLEKNSIRTIAYEINRTDEQFLEFLISETLRNSLKEPAVSESFIKRNVNHDAQAFLIWSKSPLQRESLNSELILFDRNKSILGQFAVGLNSQVDFFDFFSSPDSSSPQIREMNFGNKNANKKILGLVAVYRENILSGYIGVAAELDMESFGFANYPDFLESDKAVLGSVVDLNLINVFEFTDGHVAQVYGDIFPSKEQKDQIFNAKLSEFNDGWVNLSLYGENYITFVLKTKKDGADEITAVAVKDKQFTWNLFNFFKIFIIHSVFILILFLIFIAIKLIKVQYTFRVKLLITFLIISIIPLVLLAIYNRQVESNRTNDEIFSELRNQSNFLENHVRTQIKKYPNRELSTAFENAGNELGIAFSVYEFADQLYNSKNEFYNTGLFGKKLNPFVHFNLNYLSYREILVKENIDKFIYDAYYRKISFNNKSIILAVNDAFNKIKLTYSTADIDVFLFGIYSFAVIIIIIVSSLFANQIAAPIRRLTKATEAVAKGDLSIKLEENERGEIGDLFEGFNSMTRELQKNQSEITELERENAWKEMAKQVAHEIKNPLTPMKLSVQQILASYQDKKENFGEILKKLSQSVLNQIESLSLIATEFSTLAKMPSLKLEQIELVSIIRDTINLFSDESIQIKFNTNVTEVFAEADKSQFRRMLINLIRNAIQANSTVIDLLLDNKNSLIEIFIHDNGDGIKSENQEKIFEANFTTKDSGMGLGLKLAKRFLEGVGGQILFIDSDRKGTTFKIELPEIQKV
jgi:signal transduction histidine kinase